MRSGTYRDARLPRKKELCPRWTRQWCAGFWSDAALKTSGYRREGQPLLLVMEGRIRHASQNRDQGSEASS